MVKLFSNRIGKSTFAIAIVLFFGFSSLIYTALPIRSENSGSNGNNFANPDLTPNTQAITGNDNYTGAGDPIIGIEYANITSVPQTIVAFNNNSNGLSYVDIPPQWAEYALFASISDLYDNRTWEINGKVDSETPWEDNYVSTEGEAWGGWVSNVPLNPLGQGALFLHSGYSPGDHVWSTDYCSYSEKTYLNRSAISAVKLTFDYWVNTSGYGLALLFTQINACTRYISAFEVDSVNKTWVHAVVDLTSQDIATYLNAPQNITIKLGINTTLNDVGITNVDGYIFQEIYFDNISLWVQGAAKPSQVQLKCNGNRINDWNYGSGNRTIAEYWYNPTTDFQPIQGNFTGNSTGMTLTATLTAFVNQTKESKTTQDPAANPGTTFWVSNQSIVNWTAYYYAYSPSNCENYNFSIACPLNWNIWGAFEPINSLNVLSDLSVKSESGLKYIEVNSSNAYERAGWWRLEFYSSNPFTQTNLYGNSTSEPDWVEKSIFLAGDSLNVTATLPSATDGTVAQLDLKFPNGSLWNSQLRFAIVSGGRVTFEPIQFPATNVPDYIVGNYKVFVTWNNSVSGSPCNETGLITTMFLLQHASKLIPEKPIFDNIAQDDLVDLNVTFLDRESDVAITGAKLWFTNTTGNNQSLTMVKPGYYYAVTNITVLDLSGEIIFTVYGNHSLYTDSSVNISIRFSIPTSLVTNNSDLSVIWGDSFTVEVNFTQTITYFGITSASITTDWDVGYWEWVNKGNGNYSITCNSSSVTANRNYVLIVRMDAIGFISKSLPFSVVITAREAALSSVILNDVDITLARKLEVPATSPLNFTVKWWDLSGDWGLISGANIQVDGIGEILYNFTREVDDYRCLISAPDLSIGSHSITITATRPNFKNTSLAFEIKVNKIQVNIHTKENTNAYSTNTTTPFMLGVYVEDLAFARIITGCAVDYTWEKGSGILTDPDGDGYYTADFGTLPAGTWEFTIKVYVGPNYETKEYTVLVTVSAVEGLPMWLLYLMISSLAVVIVAVLSYVFYFRFPPNIRQIRSVKRSIKKGNKRPIITRSSDALLAGDYLTQSQAVLPNTTQSALRKRSANIQISSPKVMREEPQVLKQPVEKKEENLGGNA